MNKLLGLPEICLPVQELDDYLQKISTDSSVVVEDKYAEGIEKISSVLERIGIGLAPLDEDMAEIAHRNGEIGSLQGSLRDANSENEKLRREIEQHLLRSRQKFTVEELGRAGRPRGWRFKIEGGLPADLGEGKA